LQKKGLNVGELRGDLLEFDCRAYPIDHSVKGAVGFVVETDRGSCVYPGDVRMHGLQSQKTVDFLEVARSPRPYVLFMEGTNIAEVPEEVTGEEDVARNVRQILSNIVGEFAIADFGPRNIERLEIFLRAAREHHRKLVVTPKDAFLLRAISMVDPKIPVPGDDMVIFDSAKASEGGWEELVFMEFEGATVKASALGRSPGDYLLAFSFLDIKHLVDIRPDGGHYIYSSSEAFTEDQAIDFRRLQAWLDKFGLKSHGFWFEADRLKFSKGKEGLHASGHAPAADLERIIHALNPEIIVPLHTENPALFVERFGGDHRVVQPLLLEWTEL
jgi:ribonuclease J